MKLRKNKKGFTVVELVIVIAVIGVLSGVLIPAFLSLSGKANEASDQSLVKNLNTVLAIAENEPDYEKSKNPTEMFEVLERKGYIGETLLKDHKSDKVILYNLPKNRFLFEENKNSAEFSGSLPQDFWTFGLTPDTTGYSTFLYKEYSSSEPITVTSGLDVGLNDELTQITYNPGTGVSKDVIIRTNGENLRIDAPLSSVQHFGNASVLVIDAIKSSSYHEFGTVGNAQIKTGRIVIENENASIDNLLLVAKTDKSGFEDIVLQTKAGAALPALDRTDVNIHPNGTLVLNVVTPTSDEYVYLTKAGVIEQIVVTNEDVDTTTKNVTEAETAKPVEDTSEKTQAVAEQIANVGKKNDQGQYVDSEDNVIEIEDLTIDNIVIEEEKADDEAIETGTTLFAGGAGTLKSPYMISNSQELSNIREFLTGNFKVVNDIDMSGITSWTPIGTGSAPFKGTFDGCGYAIKNWTTRVEMFGTIAGTPNPKLTGEESDLLDENYNMIEANVSENNYSCVLKNISYENCNITITPDMGTVAYRVANAYVANIEFNNNNIRFDNSYRSGIFFGTIYGSHIHNLHLSDNNNAYVQLTDNDGYFGNDGIMIGCIYSPNNANETYNQYQTIISNCVNDVSMSFDTGTCTYGYIGGILGFSSSNDRHQLVINCTNNGDFTVNNQRTGISFGGICGAHAGGSYLDLVNCTNNGNITVTGLEVGDGGAYGQLSGICSYVGGPFVNCTNNGNISGPFKFVGGIAGASSSNVPTIPPYINCNNNGILSSTYPDALVGDIFGKISSAASLTVSAANINSVVTTAYKITLTSASGATGTMIVPASSGQIEVSGAFGFNSVDVSNVKGRFVFKVSNANFTLLGDNQDVSFTLEGTNNTMTIGSGTNIDNVKIDGEGNTVINNGTINHLTIVNTSEESTNNGVASSVEFIGDNHLSMKFVNNGTIGQPDQNWHTVQTQNPINLTFTNNGVIRGYGEKYALLFYGLSDVVFNAGSDSSIVVENPIYTAIFYNADSMRANSVTFNAEIGADGTTEDSYYGISSHETGGTQISVNIVTGYYIDLNWTQKMLNTRAQVVGGDYNDCYANYDANHCTSNGVACSTSYRYILTVSENYSHNNDKPFRIAVVFYNSTTGQITEIIGSGVPAVYFGDVVSAGNTLTFAPSSSESDRFYITGWYATTTNEPDVYSENISLFAERIVENN